MPRAPRADEAGGLYHVLNRGNSRARIFRKEADYEAFERILGEGLARYQMQLFCCQLMPNHWHLVLRPTRDGEMGESTAQQLGLSSTINPRGRPQVRFDEEPKNNDS